jgi:hypothetical protein
MRKGGVQNDRFITNEQALSVPASKIIFSSNQKHPTAITNPEACKARDLSVCCNGDFPRNEQARRQV